jgi:DNA polymerase sigma
VLFGSYSIDFALRDSDLDIVCVVDGDEVVAMNAMF